MSALSLIGQFPTTAIEVPAGNGATGAQDIVLTQVIPVGTYLGNVQMSIQGAGVTSGDFIVSIVGGINLSTTILGASNVQSTASSTFFFTSNGTDELQISIVGTGANWTSPASTLYLRQIA